MYHCKISFGGRATTERWIVADSILSVSGSGRETSAGSRSRSTMVRKTSFLSSEAQWGQRAARQQGAEINEKNAADGDEDEVASSSSSEGPSSSSRKKTRKRKAASANSIGRSSTGRSTTSSSRSSSSQLSRRKRTRRRRHETSPSLNDPFSEASEGEDHQKEEDDNNDEEDWGGYNRSTGNAGYCLV